jgi:hypothetical protein
MPGRRVRDATNKERLFAHAGETVSRQVLEKPEVWPITPAHPKRAKTRSFPAGIQ